MLKEYITVIGSLNYDIIMKQKRLPAVGETYTADSVTFAGGGKGANQAVQCAKMNVNTYMIGKVGNDNFGDYLIGELEKYKVNTEFIQRSDKNTGLGVVNVLNDGSVYATISTGANFDFTEADIDNIDDVIIGSKILILQLEIPTKIVEYIIKMAYENGVYIILNAAPAKEISKDALLMVNCLVVNEAESSFYAGDTITDEQSARNYAHKLLGMVKETIIITLGEKGSLLCENDKLTFIPANKVDKVIETTGAGDSYIGAFAYSKFIDKTNVEACELASRVSSITVTGIGAQPAMPFLNDLI